MAALAYLLRALGLELVNTLLRKWRAPEPPKVVLRASFWRALSKVSIHIFPITCLSVLIWLNYGTLYIGPTFTEWARYQNVLLAMIQVFAKILELLCVASLGTIVLEALRREILGDGVPIGLLGSGTWFSSLSSFWSPDFLAAAPWSVTTLQRFQLYGLIIISGAIAAFIGPASAVLMLPRNQDMPVGRTSFYLPGTYDQLYPGNVTSASEPDVCAYANATKYAVCPSGGYTSLRSTMNTFNYSDFSAFSGFRYAPQIQATGAWGDWFDFDITIQSPQSLTPPVISTFALRSIGGETYAFEPHAATVNVMQQLVRDWASLANDVTRGSHAEWKWAYDFATSGSATSPWVRTRCSDPQELPADATQAEFPLLIQPEGSDNPGSISWDPGDHDASYYIRGVHDYTAWGGNMSRSIAGLDRSESAYLRTQWMNLPAEVYGDLHLRPSGMLMEFPWADGSRVAIGCAVAAAWHNSTISADRSTNYDAWAIDRTVTSNAGGFQPQNNADSITSNKPVFLDESWLKLLTPLTPVTYAANDSWQPNTLEAILDDAGYNNVLQDIQITPQWLWNGTACYFGTLVSNVTSAQALTGGPCENSNAADYIEFALALMVADGLSRYGSYRVFDVQPSLQNWALLQPSVFNTSLLLKQLLSSPAPSSNLVTQWLTIDVVGYGYYASTTTDYIALGVVVAYLLIALSHLFWTLLSKDNITSASMETITELLVLCQNSPSPAPQSGLANASGGIEHLGTYTTVVKVRAAKTADGPAEQAIQLVVEDEDDLRQKSLEEVKVGSEYA